MISPQQEVHGILIHVPMPSLHQEQNKNNRHSPFTNVTQNLKVMESTCRWSSNLSEQHHLRSVTWWQIVFSYVQVNIMAVAKTALFHTPFQQKPVNITWYSHTCTHAHTYTHTHTCTHTHTHKKPPLAKGLSFFNLMRDEQHTSNDRWPTH